MFADQQSAATLTKHRSSFLTRPLTARRPLTEIIVVIRGPMGRVETRRGSLLRRPFTGFHRSNSENPSYYGGMLERLAKARLSKTDHSDGLDKLI